MVSDEELPHKWRGARPEIFDIAEELCISGGGEALTVTLHLIFLFGVYKDAKLQGHLTKRVCRGGVLAVCHRAGDGWGHHFSSICWKSLLQREHLD